MSVEQLTRIQFRVHGVPVTQGSLRAFLPRDKKTGRLLTKYPIVTHANKQQLRPWRDAVATEALRACGGRPLLDGPLAVQMRFLLPRPKSMPAELRTVRQRWQWAWPWRKPDLSRCVRAVEDALTGVLYHDDAQIVRIATGKEYSTDPGLEVVVEQLV